MDVPQLSPQLIDALRTWFHPKDRSVYLAPSTFAYLPGGVGYLSMAFISETVLSASAASVTFSNIPQNFRHLVLTCQVRSNNAAEGDSILMQFNTTTAGNYDWIQMYANAATAAASTSRSQTSISIGVCDAANARGNNYSPILTWIMDYSRVAETRIFSLSSQIGDLSADADMFLVARAGNFRNTDVITAIIVSPFVGGTFAINSRFQLYGVL